MRVAGQGNVIASATRQHESELASLVDRYAADRQSLIRRYNVEYSPERYARLSKFYKEWQQEGWALSWEVLLWDDGFPKTPENRKPDRAMKRTRLRKIEGFASWPS